MVDKRRKRNVRDTSIPPMVLTERDKHILEMVYQCRVLRQDHLHQLFFGSSETASQRRLALLYHHGFLERKFLTVRASYLLSPALYMLDTRGAEVLRAELGYETFHWQSKDKQVGQQFLEHTLMINDVRVAITLACRIHNLTLPTWKSEADLKAAYDRVEIRDVSGRKKSISLIPDSYFVLDTPRGKTHFFLECDRGHMSAQKFATKIAAYITYYRSGAYEERYKTTSLRVLTVVLSQKRLETLKRVTEQTGGDGRFWFGLLPEFQPQTILTSPLWWAATGDKRFTLI